MVFGFFRKKAPPPKKEHDPLAAFDQMIESVERQGVEVRKSAATLLALRSQLKVDHERLVQRIATFEEKVSRASDDAQAAHTLSRDLDDVRRLLTKTGESLAQADRDSKLLLETAESLGRQLVELKEERVSAKTRLSAGLMVSDALKERVASFDKLMRLDEARDEVERAHALAELYREEQGD